MRAVLRTRYLDVSSTDHSFEVESRNFGRVIEVDQSAGGIVFAPLDCDFAFVGGRGARAGAAGEARVAVFDPAEVGADIDVEAVVGEGDAFEARLSGDFDRATSGYDFDLFAGRADDVNRAGGVDLVVAAVGIDRRGDFAPEEVDVAAFEFECGGFDRREFVAGDLRCLCGGRACD